MENIRVVVRIRPDEIAESQEAASIDKLLSSEIESHSHYIKNCCLTYDTNQINITANRSSQRSESNDFRFDRVFDHNSSQDDVYDYAKDLIDSSLSGYNATIFAFGMTGSGKTYTIAGGPRSPGILPRTIHHVFSSLRQKTSHDSKSYVSMVFLTYIELYNNNLYDLLAPDQSSSNASSNNLKIHDHPTLGITITGSSTIRTKVTTEEETLALIARGTRYRATASTNLNERSSRSHTIITLEIVRQLIVDNISSSSSSLDIDKDKTNSSEFTSVGKINLVDLAGSERVKLSGAEGQALEEAKQINKALTVLGDVLNSLSKYESDKLKQEKEREGYPTASAAGSTLPGRKIQPSYHVPYRNSKLTMLLKDSLGGNSKSMMIATIRQSELFYQQTMITLRYASRAKLIHCSPMQNIQMQDTNDAKALKLAVNEVTKLKDVLQKRTNEYNEMKARLKELERQKQALLQSTSSSMVFDKSVIEAKEQEYRKQLDDIQQQSIKEQQSLRNHLKGVIHQHNALLSDKEYECNQLEIKLADQLTHIENLSRDHHQAIENKKHIEMNNIELSNQIILLSKEIDQLKHDNNQLSNQNMFISSEYDMMKGNHDMITNELSLTKSDLKTAKEKVHTLKSEFVILKRELTSAKEDNNVISNELASLKKLYEVTTSSNHMISSKDRDMITETITKLSNSRNKYKKLYDDSCQQINDMNQQIQLKDEEISSHKQSIESHHNEYSKLQGKLNDHNEIIQEATKTIRKLDKKIESQRYIIEELSKNNELDKSLSLDRNRLRDEERDRERDRERDEERDRLFHDDYLRQRMLAQIHVSTQTPPQPQSQVERPMVPTIGRDVKSKSIQTQNDDLYIVQMEEHNKNQAQMRQSLQDQLDQVIADYELSMTKKETQLTKHYEALHDKVVSKHKQDILSLTKSYEDKMRSYHDNITSLTNQIDLIVHTKSLKKSIGIQVDPIPSSTSVKKGLDVSTSPMPSNKISSDETFHPTTTTTPIKLDHIYHLNNETIQLYDKDIHDVKKNMEMIATIHHDEKQQKQLVPINDTPKKVKEIKDNETELTPRSENVLLKNKIILLQENDKEMMDVLEKRLHELNDARMKLLKLNSYIQSNHIISSYHQELSSSSSSSPIKSHDENIPNKYHQLIETLENSIIQEKMINTTLQIQLDDKNRIIANHDAIIARLYDQINNERITRHDEIEKAVKVATKFVVDNQLRRSNELDMLGSILSSSNDMDISPVAQRKKEKS